ncbi:MAG: ribonuclease P protein component [Cardiobacteriaceae bacterium]|nr:ribonuclease P protein component [Cardiobacteriaceae bacterium]
MDKKSFPKTSRLLKRAEFQAVFNNPQKKSSDRYFTVLALIYLSESPKLRLGLAIAKKKIHLAVDRNRIKRISRESFRKIDFNYAKKSSDAALIIPSDNLQDDRKCCYSYDIVLMAKTQAREADNQALFKSLQHHWRRILS